jgi:hypothetical protein
MFREKFYLPSSGQADAAVTIVHKLKESRTYKCFLFLKENYSHGGIMGIYKLHWTNLPPSVLRMFRRGGVLNISHPIGLHGLLALRLALLYFYQPH